MRRNKVQLNPGVDLSDTFRRYLRVVLFQPPLPEPCLHLSAHTALQFPGASQFTCVSTQMLSHRSLDYLLYNLLPFPLRQAFPDSLVGRDSHEYYGSSVTMSLSAFRRSRIPVKLDVSTFRSCLSSNPFIGGHSPQEALLTTFVILCHCGVTDSGDFSPPDRLRWMRDFIVSDVGSASASPQVQPQAYPCVQGWQVLLRYLSSRFPASGHATVPQEVSLPEVRPFTLKGQCSQPFFSSRTSNLPLDGAHKHPVLAQSCRTRSVLMVTFLAPIRSACRV